MLPIWVSILIAVIAGISAGVIAPFVTALLTKRNWRRQKRLELKHEVFLGATAALSAQLVDAHDIVLQENKPSTKSGRTPLVAMRLETSQALEQHRGLVAAFFTDDVYVKFDEAGRAEVTIESVPNTDFEEKRKAFIQAAAAELQI